MTPREWWNQVPLRVVVLLIGAAIAFATLEAQVMRMQIDKADSAKVEAMAQDIKDIKTIICGKDNPDSACAK
jgi:hypothetical protein